MVGRVDCWPMKPCGQRPWRDAGLRAPNQQNLARADDSLSPAVTVSRAGVTPFVWKSEVHRVGNEDSYGCWKFPLPAIIVTSSVERLPTYFIDCSLWTAELGEISANLSLQFVQKTSLDTFFFILTGQISFILVKRFQRYDGSKTRVDEYNCDVQTVGPGMERRGYNRVVRCSGGRNSMQRGKHWPWIFLYCF